jgi:sterol desaturase/sphingolipid hydroxylase (fatty acid hydroxylase superfamily)
MLERGMSESRVRITVASVLTILFGALRHVLVTPQSHRVHHSRLPLDANHNYGAMLSVWDYLFRTQYGHCGVYPRTGIDDEEFPAENTHSLTIPIRQMVYPFSQLVSRA